MKVSDFKNLLDEVCVYTVDLYKKNNVFSPDFTLKRADASLIKQSKFWPDTTQEKDGYGGGIGMVFGGHPDIKKNAFA